MPASVPGTGRRCIAEPVVGPTLAAQSVAAPMGNPVRTVFDSAGRQMAANDNLGNINPGSELSQVPGVPNHPSECALVLVLPPGTFLVAATGSNGTTGPAFGAERAVSGRCAPSASAPIRSPSIAAAATATCAGCACRMGPSCGEHLPAAGQTSAAST